MASSEGFLTVSSSVKITTFYCISVIFFKVYIFRIKVKNCKVPVTISSSALMTPFVFL